MLSWDHFEKIERWVDSCTVAIISYMTWIDYWEFALSDVIRYYKHTLLEKIKKN